MTAGDLARALARLRWDPAQDPAAPVDPAAFRDAMWAMELWRRWFRATITGVEHLRAVEGALLVSNHGALGLDLPALIKVIYDATHRPLRSLGDRVIFRTPGVRAAARAIGIVEGEPEATVRLLRHGELVLVYPGGAAEAVCAPEDRYKLMWDGHYGFVRTALRAQVPIVPVAGIGVDETLVQVLSRARVRQSVVGRLVEARLGDKYVLPVFMGAGFFPLPVPVRYLVGAPIDLASPPEAARDQRVVEAAHARVKAATEALITEGLRERAREGERAGGGLGLRARIAALVER